MIRRRRFKFQLGFAALLVLCFFSWLREAISETTEKPIEVVEEVLGMYSLCTEAPPPLPQEKSGEETSFPLPMFPEGGGTSVHRLRYVQNITTIKNDMCVLLLLGKVV